MYKVFLVDDEIIVREGIRNTFPWDQGPYTLAGEAPDGEMALAMIQDIKPDILITDIRMPFMDGLSLSRIVKKTLPWIKIVILSGHDEFEYAREALSMGVEEYLLKPVSVQDMLKALDKIAKTIDEEKEKLLNIENLKTQIQSSTEILRDKWLSDFINGRIPPEEAIEQGREFNIDLLARSYITAVIVIVNGEKEEQPGPEKKILQSIMEQYTDSIWFAEKKKHFVLLIKEMTGESISERAAALEESVYAIAQAFKYEVERNTGSKVMVGIGFPSERIGQVPSSYQAALKAAEYGISRGLAQIADSKIADGTADTAAPENDMGAREFPDINGETFLLRLRYATKKDISGIIDEYTKTIKNNFDEMSAYFIFGEFVVAATKIVESLGGDIKEITPFSLEKGKVRNMISSWDIYIESLSALIKAVIEYRDSHTGGRYQAVIVKTREYIDSNFASGNISLYSTASHVGISPNHLSTVFAQETGEKFIDYLTRIRLEKAKYLLQNTSMKSANIAFETGFNDPHYFSYIFKKNTGLSPRDYRLKEQDQKKTNITS